MSILRKRTAPAAPTYTVVQETNRFPIAQGWVWQECIVRTADGALELWEIPLRRLGGSL
jgi:hypothetical protein